MMETIHLVGTLRSKSLGIGLCLLLKSCLATTEKRSDECSLYLAESTVPGAGHGIFTTEDIAQGTELVSAHMEHCLTKCDPNQFLWRPMHSVSYAIPFPCRSYPYHSSEKT